MKPDNIKITIICWKCDRKFKIQLEAVKNTQTTIYFDEDDQELGPQLIQPKTYSLPCPYCKAENEVKLP